MAFFSFAIDTKVVVSGLITGDAASPVCRILDAMPAARLPFLLSPALLAEYRTVLLRTKMHKLHGLQAADIDRILTEIAVNAIWREPAKTISAPEAADDHLWALLVACRGSVLVTGDRLLLDNPPDFASVISPRTFLENWGITLCGSFALTPEPISRSASRELQRACR